MQAELGQDAGTRRGPRNADVHRRTSTEDSRRPLICRPADHCSAVRAICGTIVPNDAAQRRATDSERMKLSPLLGHGAMGEVYRARDTRLGRDVAIKVLPAAFANDPDRLARLEREARLISQVNHPNICTLFHIVEGTCSVLILELVEGETMQQRLLQRPAAVPRRVALCRRYRGRTRGRSRQRHHPSRLETGQHQDHLRRNGQSARLWRREARRASDVGVVGVPISRQTLGGTKEGVLVGTVAYMSPEQAMGDRVDRRSDIWAFGCVLYEMLTARRAFPRHRRSPTRLAPSCAASQIGRLCPPERRRRSASCCGDASRRIARRRLADIADARLEIEDLLAGRSEHAPQSRCCRRPTARSPPARRRGHWIAVLAFVAGVIFASVMAFLWSDARGQRSLPPVENSRSVSGPTASSRGNASPPSAKSKPHLRLLPHPTLATHPPSTTNARPARDAPASSRSCTIGRRCLRSSVFRTA